MTRRPEALGSWASAAETQKKNRWGRIYYSLPGTRRPRVAGAGPFGFRRHAGSSFGRSAFAFIPSLVWQGKSCKRGSPDDSSPAIPGSVAAWLAFSQSLGGQEETTKDTNTA